MPNAVNDATSVQQRLNHSNIHRGVHQLSERSTAAFEGAREKVRRFINAASLQEVIFTRGTTESINLVAATFGRQALGAGDEVLITWMEHHSNIVPWQLVCEQTGASLRVVPITDAGDVDLAAFGRLLTPRTRLVSVVHVSNSLGTLNPVAIMVRLAHERGVPVLIDGAQAAAHLPLDVRALGCDFYAWSAHKVYGPTGVGVLYGKAERLDSMPPWQGGGDMIASVTFEKTTFAGIPARFEAGTPNVAGVVGLGAALAYLDTLDRQGIGAHEDALVARAVDALSSVDGVRLVGTPARRVGVVSFVMDGVHPHDIGTIVDREGVAIRTGQHCTQPVMDRFGVPATARASFSFYNTTDDVDRLIAALARVREIFG
jgi:cysteine desulfurase/selenocysteine lyase